MYEKLNQRLQIIRTVLTALLFLLSISNSNAYLEVVSSDPTFYKMRISYVFTSATLTGPSDNELSLMAKIESQEVAMNKFVRSFGLHSYHFKSAEKHLKEGRTQSSSNR